MDMREKQLIDDVAEQVRSAHPVVKDPQAEAAIARLIGSQPDAVYVLTQTVVVQADALAAARAQIESLNTQLAQPTTTQRAPVGGFAASLFGKPAQPDPFSSAPPPAAPPPSRSGGFLATTATVAVGAAGGSLLAQGLGSLFGGEHNSGAGRTEHTQPEYADGGDDDY